MPNWCLVWMNLEGSEKAVHEFDNQFRGMCDSKGDVSPFNYTLARELWNKRKHAYENDELTSYEMSRRELASQVMLDRESEYLDYSDEFSYSGFVPIEYDSEKEYDENAYNDHCNKWGCKWDAASVSSEHAGVYSWSSPWVYPQHVFEEMMNEYPELKFNIIYDESGVGFCGEITKKSGENEIKWVTERDYYDDYRIASHNILEEEFVGVCPECGALLFSYDDEWCPACEYEFDEYIPLENLDEEEINIMEECLNNNDLYIRC